ncbi:MAG: hypothetical protein IPM54_30285 [Polyangiaceae bacterium]|nr:hypothetical protein [Polyangiaceae bacterium]
MLDAPGPHERALCVLLDTQDELGGRGFLLCQSRDLPQDTEGRQIHVGGMDELHRLAVMRPTHGVGGVQCAEADWFHRVRGYDEGYKGWGAEDADLVVRAERDGRVVKWVTEQTMMFHQWHPTAKYDRPWLVKKNKFRLTLTGWIVRKNWFGWGE